MRKDKRLYFLLTSILIFFMFYKVPIIGDDVYNWQHRYMFNTISKDISYVMFQYGNWSSRTIINFFMFFFSTHNIIWFSLVTAIAFYILLNSLSTIFNYENNHYIDICLCFLVLIIPFPYLSTAGWIATTTTYLWPIIVAIYASIPLFIGQKLRVIQYVLSGLGIIYAANNEQVMIVLMVMYTALIIIKAIKQDFNDNYKYCCLQLLFILLDFIYFIFCPGNTMRSHAETLKWFPEFANLNALNKIDIGFMTTGQHILFSNSIVVLLLTLLILWIHFLYTKNNLVLPGVNLALLIISNILFDIFIVTGHLYKYFTFSKLGLLKGDNLSSIIQCLLYLCFFVLLITTYYYGQNQHLYIEMLILFIGSIFSRIE